MHHTWTPSPTPTPRRTSQWNNTRGLVASTDPSRSRQKRSRRGTQRLRRFVHACQTALRKQSAVTQHRPAIAELRTVTNSGSANERDFYRRLIAATAPGWLMTGLGGRHFRAIVGRRRWKKDGTGFYVLRVFYWQMKEAGFWCDGPFRGLFWLWKQYYV